MPLLGAAAGVQRAQHEPASANRARQISSVPTHAPSKAIGTSELKPAIDVTDSHSRLVRALAHPLRVEILGLLEDRVASPSELAEQLHATVGSVSYHVRILASLKLIRLMSETPRRGAVEHHYTAVALPVISDEAWSEVPEIVKQPLVSVGLEQARAAINAAASTGGFHRPEAHLSRVGVVLDAEGWRMMADETRSWMQRVEEISRETADRLARGDGAGDHATMLTMFFQSPPDTEGVADAVDHHQMPDQSCSNYVWPRADGQTAGT